VQQAFGFLVGIAVLLAIAVFFVITILWAWGHLLELRHLPQWARFSIGVARAW
jgi:hypothetical protein